jgi:hypothetical protein
VSAAGDAYYFRQSPRQYFWVPEGVESFSIRAATGRGKQEMRLQVWRPGGEQALDHVVNSDEDFRQTLEIAVPEGMSGNVWSLAVSKPEEMSPTHYSENYYLRIEGAEPWLADRPEAVLGRE